VSASEIIDRLRPKLSQVALHAGISRHQCRSPVQPERSTGSPSRTAISTELDHWAPILLKALQGIPFLRDVATDQQIAGPTVRLEINRDAASRRRVATQAIDDTLYDGHS
jgi:multidrug efflux pump subunit AcrB